MSVWCIDKQQISAFPITVMTVGEGSQLKLYAL